MSEIVELADWTLPEPYCNVIRRRITFIGKQKLTAHEHNYGHAHAVFRGVIRCTLKKDGEILSVTDYRPGEMFEIPAWTGHQLESLCEDGAEGWCLFAVRDEDGGVVYEPTDKQKNDHFNSDRLGGGDNVSAT